MLESYAIGMTVVLVTLLMAQSYLRHVVAGRPPVGVFNRSDVAVLLVGVVVMPFVYLAVPASVAVPVFGVVMVAILAMSLAPVFSSGLLALLVAVALGAADLGLSVLTGPDSPALRIANALLLVIAVSGLANVWVQSGMRARHLIVLAAALVVYDTAATTFSAQTMDLFMRLGEGPFAPFFVWRVADGEGLTIGLGDLLLATIFVILVDKGYGPRAATAALATVGGVLAVMAGLAVTDVLPGFLPGMWGLAPVIIAHTTYLLRTRGPERTVAQFREAVAAH
jgi:hypothetical protein